MHVFSVIASIFIVDIYVNLKLLSLPNLLNSEPTDSFSKGAFIMFSIA